MKPLFSLAVLLGCLLPAHAQTKTPALPPVVWRDATTKQPLFTSADVLGYDQYNGLLLLTRQKTEEFAQWSQTSRHNLEVEDQQGLIYKASIDDSAFGFSFDAPTYRPGIPIHIQLLPHSKDFKAEFTNANFQASHASERLTADLKQLGLLHELPLFSQAASGFSSPSWQKVNESVSIWPSLSSRSLRVGQPTYASLFFSFAPEQEEVNQSLPAPNLVTLEITMVANEGRFTSHTLIGPLDVRQVRKNVADFRFNPWTGLEGSALPTTGGDAKMSLSVLFQKQGKHGLETVARLSYAPVSLIINAPDAKK